MLSRRRFPRHAVTAGCAVAISAITLLANPASAAPNPGAAESTDSSSFSLLNPGMLEAMQRDLGLTQNQAQTRLANEARAMTTVEKLQASLGDAYAGSWVTGTTSDVLVVATSDASKAGAILAAGAQPKIVSRSMATLEAAKNALDNAGTPPASTRVWYVDVKTNSVVVQSANPAEAEAFITSAGVDKSLVRVERSNEQPRPFDVQTGRPAAQPQALNELRGGDAYYIETIGAKCSIGFSVRRGSTPGFVTAGICGRPGYRTYGVGWIPQGVFQASVYPGGDYAWVAVNSGWIPRPWVKSAGAYVIVRGSTEAPVGSSVCRSGSATGWRCGLILQRDVTVDPGGTRLTGVAYTNVCAEPTDLGGSFITGNQAQGTMAAARSGNCTTGGTSFFTPINVPLSRFGLTLVTG